MKKIVTLPLLFLFASVLFVACTTAAPAESGNLEVNDVWGRTSPMAAANGAFYMVIENKTNTDDSLLSAATEACGTAELHEMYMKENDVMGMRPVEGGVILVPAGETVELKAGGMHVMCLDKQVDFSAGDIIPIALVFETAGEMVVEAEIRDTADSGMNMEDDDTDMDHDNMDMDSDMEHDDGDSDE
ncbi:MAG: copper chaperone PCu(A)C [Chloroflexi bacterium]|nr:copper chaperone PCu(A)C [Chloroflexota bacterium]